MGLLLLEALGAMVLLILIVWWTMFSGRKKGEPDRPAALEDISKPADGSSGDRRSDRSDRTDEALKK